MAKTHKITAEDGWKGILFALDNAEVGDTITLAPGQYFGDQNLLINRPLTLQGSNGVELIYSGNDSAILVGQTEMVSILELKIKISNKKYTRITDTGFLSCITVSLSKDIMVQGNQCFGQGVSDAGILFLSSTGTVENNECWGNHQSGIILHCDSDSLHQPSDAQLTNNRCHDNGEAGIAFSSSTGNVDNNECWGNHQSGIILQCNEYSPHQPSDAQLTNNRCYNNREAGIVFHSSTGSVHNNECWGNRKNKINKLSQEFENGMIGSASVVLEDPTHKTECSIPLAELLESRINQRNDSPLILSLLKQQVEQTKAERLGDFIQSGCTDCFNAYIANTITEKETVETTNSLPKTDVSLYKVSDTFSSNNTSKIKSTAIQRITCINERDNQEQGQIQAKNILADQQCAIYQQDIVKTIIENHCQQSTGKTYAIAYVTEELKTLDAWIDKLKHKGYLNRLACEYGKNKSISCGTPFIIDYSVYQESEKTENDAPLAYQSLLNASLLNNK